MVLPLLARAAPDDRFVCVFDATRKNFRNDIYPEYKANRAETPADLLVQTQLTWDAARAMGMPVLALHGVEADDVIATLAARECNSGITRIVTSDKDLMQLVSDCIFLYDGMKEKEIREPEVLEKFGVRPDQVIDVQSLMGDSSDNVPGVPGIGPKKAAELINDFGTLDGLYENLDAVKNDRIRGLLRDNRDKAYISRQLVSLKSDVQLPEFDAGYFKFNRDAFLEFAKVGMESNSMVAKVDKLFPFCGAAAETNGGAGLEETHLKRQPLEKVALPNSHTFSIIRTESELDAFLAGVEKVIAIDTETTGLDQMADKVVGISLAIDSHRGAYIPIRHSEIQRDLFDKPPLGCSAATPPQGGGDATPNQLPIEIVRQKLWGILTNPNIVKIGHNLKYDLHILANEGQSRAVANGEGGWDANAIAPIDDTMLLSYVLHGTAHAHNIDELAKIYLDYETIKFASLFPPKTKSKDMHFDALSVEVAAPYAAEDATICFALYELFKRQLDSNDSLRKLYETCDRPLLKVLFNMERAGVLVDRSKLHNLSAIFHKDMQALEKEIHALAGREFNIASPQQLAVVLYDELGLPRHKSTDADTLAELEHPIAAKVLEWRSIAKLAGTYADALPRQIASDGRIHTTYLQTSTNTGRLSSRDPNLQNIPIKTALGEQIRKCFVAPTGRVLISADYSQIQLRLLADVADVKTFKETFERGEDIHEETARKVFGIAPGVAVPRDLRAKAKTLNFSIIYGISSFGLATQLGVARSEAQNIINSYLAGLPEVAAYFDRTRQFALENGFVYTPMGRRIELPDVRNPRLRAYALRAAINAPIQGYEADLMRLAMVKIGTNGQGSRGAEGQVKPVDTDGLLSLPICPSAHLSLCPKLIMQVHDEMVFECDAESAPDFAAYVKNMMETIATLSVPLLAETTISTEWGK
jgi:DNA polymerase-1